MRFEGRTLQEALEAAAKGLQCSLLEVEYEIISNAKRGFFGFGRQNAVIEASKPVAKTKFDTAKNAKHSEQNAKNAKHFNKHKPTKPNDNQPKEEEDDCFLKWVEEFANEPLNNDFKLNDPNAAPKTAPKEAAKTLSKETPKETPKTAPKAQPVVEQTAAQPLSKRAQRRLEREKRLKEKVFVLDEFEYFEKESQEESKGQTKKEAVKLSEPKNYSKLNIDTSIFDGFYKESGTGSEAAKNATQQPKQEQETTPNKAQKESKNSCEKPSKEAIRPSSESREMSKPNLNSQKTSNADPKLVESEVKAGVKELLEVCGYDAEVKSVECKEGKVFVVIDGTHAALLIGRDGRRFEAIFTLLQNWFMLKFSLNAQLEIANFYASKKEANQTYIQELVATLKTTPKLRTKFFEDETSLRIVLEALREAYPHKYIAAQNDHNGRCIYIKDFKNKPKQ